METTDERLDAMVRSLEVLPDEALTRLQYLQPEIGCFNSCAFCSQEAGSSVWQLDAQSVRYLVRALAITAQKRGLKVAAGRTEHRQGVLFPYLDNDCFSYPYLDVYLQELVEQLDVKVRVATVGFSRHNADLVAMHQRIVSQHSHAFAGIRFSFTPYTGGWAAQSGNRLARDEYEADLAHAMRLYLPVFHELGIGKATACAELRFHPHVRTVEVTECVIDGHHVVHAGPHVLVSKHEVNSPPPIARIEKVVDAVATYSCDPASYLHLIAEDLLVDRGLQGVVESILDGSEAVRTRVAEVPVYRFENADGPYYAVSPDFWNDGQFYALHIYPATTARTVSGYNNATRYFLNALLRVKAQLGYARREAFESAEWSDVTLVLNKLTDQIKAIEESDPHTALHIRQHVLPLVESYVRVMRLAELSPSLFFDRNFTIDTGQIVNQGRARKLFRGIVNDDDEPITPREARAYGDPESVSAQRGRIWRIVPKPFSENNVLTNLRAGGKALIETQAVHAMAVHEVSEHTLRPVDSVTGEKLRNFTIHGVDITTQTRSQSWTLHLQPGSVGEAKE